MGANSGHEHCTCTVQGGGGRPRRKNFPAIRPGRARIGPTKATTAANLGHRIFMFSSHFKPTYTTFPQFQAANIFFFFFSNSSPFERYDKNKVGRLLDRVFRPPQQPLDQGESMDVFLVSWAFHGYVFCKFWTSFG